MESIVQFAILGLGLGGIYVLFALGLVLVYRGSGVVNFANTGLSLLSAVVFYETYGVGGWPVVPAIIAAIAASIAAGFVMQFAIMRPLKNASSLMRTVATLAVLSIIESATDQVYGGTGRSVRSFLPDGAFHLFGTAVGQDRLIILALSCVLTLVLWLVYRLTRFGLATTAVAANDLVPASLGWSPNRIASANWAVGAGLAGIAGVLISPIVGLQGDTIAVMVVPALTVALIGGFSSFPLTLAGGLILGLLQSETTLAATHHLAPAGASDFVPLILIIAVLVVRGKSIPLRGYLADRLPRLGSGQIHPLLLFVGLAVLWVSAQVFTANWVGAITATFVAATICLSLVVVTGFCGQLSLAQYAFAGLGALFSAHIAASWHANFIVAMIVAFLATAVIGAIVALPAIRLRGVNLAVVTLSVAVVVNSAILENPSYTGGYFGIVVPSPSIFGISVDNVNYPGRFAAVAVIVFCIAGIAVANLRRGRVGRRLIAVRSNERAATSLGVSVAGAKLYAFALGAAIAALGGSLLTFENTNAYFGGFSPVASINVVLQAVVGGIGYASGAIMGGVSASSGMAQQALSTFFNTQGWFTVYAGVLLLIVVITHHDGVVDVTIMSYRQARSVVLKAARRVFPRLGARAPKPGAEGAAAAGAVRAGGGLAAGRGLAGPGAIDLRSMFNAKTLEMRGVGISFGAVVAVDNLSLTVNPGEVVGLIGPNGAGKTTVLDIATGFHSRYRGSVLLGGQPIDKVKAVGRSRAGLMRSFQNLELFDDLTVEENIRTACEPRDRLSYVRDLVFPKKSPLGPLADAVIEEFGLTADLNRKPTDLHLAQRRLLAVARVIAARPAVLLLDEPAAGLDDTSRAELGEVIRWLADSCGLGVLLIEHDVALVLSTCDRVAALEFGELIATDTAQNIASHDGVIKSYLGTSSESGEHVKTPNPAQDAAPGAPVTMSIESPQ